METIDFNQILSYIDTHIYEKITLGKLAELAGYSPFYFSKLFSETMGMPVTGYIRIRKLQHAIMSLLEGKKVLDVSLMYAFDSHEGFTRAFYTTFWFDTKHCQKIHDFLPCAGICRACHRFQEEKNGNKLH